MDQPEPIPDPPIEVVSRQSPAWQEPVRVAAVWIRRLRWPLLLIAAIALLKDLVFRLALAWALTQTLGPVVSVRHASVGLLRPGIVIRQLEVAQPEGFPKGRLLQVREVRVRVDMPALLHGKIHLPEVAVRVHEAHLIRDGQKRLNVDALKIAQTPQPQAAELAFKIDRVTLSVDRLVYSDYTKGSPPKVEVLDNVVREKTFDNISSVRQLALAVVTHAVAPRALKSAGLMGAAGLASVGLLPAGLLAVAVSDDSSSQVFMLNWSRAFKETERFLRQHGQLKHADQKAGKLEATVQGCRVRVALEKVSDRMTRVTFSARRFLLPKPKVAAGLLYQLDQRVDD